MEHQVIRTRAALCRAIANNSCYLVFFSAALNQDDDSWAPVLLDTLTEYLVDPDYRLLKMKKGDDHIIYVERLPLRNDQPHILGGNDHE